MIVINVPVANCTPQTIVIGRRGTYETMQIAFDLSFLIENYGSGTAVLAIKRSQDESAYPAVVTQEDTTLLWTVNETDTAYVGSGECQLMWYVDGGLAKTIIYPMVVMRDILSTTEEPPDGYENWIEHLTELGAETQQNAQDAAQSASDAENAKDDAVAAKEAAEAALEEFTTPTASATTLPAGSQATATYSDGNFVFGIPRGANGSPGDPGVTPNFSIGTVTTLEPTQPATATITGTAEAPVLNLGIPKGEQGDPGQGSGSVDSVNGQTGDVVLDARDIGFDDQETYAAGTVGAELQEQSRQLSDLEATVTTTQIINTASGAIASFDDGADSMPVKKLVANIEPVQAGSGDPSPYNIRPISGHTGAEIEQTGVNLFEPLSDVNNYKAESGESFNGYDVTSLVAFLNTLPVGDYIVSFKFNVLETVSGATSWGILLRNSVNGYIDGRQTGQHNSGETLTFSKAFTITTADKGQFVNAYLYSGGGNRAKVYWYDFQLELGSTATSYEPYTGNQISVTFPSAAGTVYGGTLTLNPDGTGTLVADMVMLDLGTLNWSKDNDTKVFYTDYTINADKFSAFGYQYVSSVWVYGETINNIWNPGKTGLAVEPVGVSSQSRIYAKNQIYDNLTGAEFKQAMSGVQVVHELQSPVTYALTGEQVSGILTTLYGTNNIWADTGDVEVTYPCDTRLYIDNKITQAIANALNS